MKHVLLLLALACAACSSPTELLLVVKAGPGLLVGQGGQVDQIHVQAQPASDSPSEFFYSKYVDLCTEQGRDCRPTPYASTDYEGSLTLPVRFLLEPGNDGDDEDIRVWIDGLANGQRVLANGLRFRFSRGHRLWLEVPLFEQCLDNLSCESEDLSCGVDRDCISYTPTLSQPGADGSSPEGDLAGVDLSVGDLASHDLAKGDTTHAGDAAMRDMTSHDLSHGGDMTNGDMSARSDGGEQGDMSGRGDMAQSRDMSGGDMTQTGDMAIHAGGGPVDAGGGTVDGGGGGFKH